MPKIIVHIDKQFIFDMSDDLSEFLESSTLKEVEVSDDFMSKYLDIRKEFFKYQSELELLFRRQNGFSPLKQK